MYFYSQCDEQFPYFRVIEQRRIGPRSPFFSLSSKSWPVATFNTCLKTLSFLHRMRQVVRFLLSKVGESVGSHDPPISRQRSLQSVIVLFIMIIHVSIVERKISDTFQNKSHTRVIEKDLESNSTSSHLRNQQTADSSIFAKINFSDVPMCVSSGPS